MDDAQIREFIGEILIVGFNGMELSENIKFLIDTHRVKNVILFSRNIRSTVQVGELNESLQMFSRQSGFHQPLIICLDQENGIVRRLAPDMPGLPGNMAVGATFHVPFAREIGRTTAHQLLLAGVNMNLAPVLDVNNNQNNPVIGVRSYGEDPVAVSQFGVSMMLGLQEMGVIACGKHFPGHGDTNVDSHLDLPTVPHSLDRLNQIELFPFKEAIRHGIDTIMSAHIAFPAVEPRMVPATISKNVLKGLLREKLGFNGVIVTDCLEMNAISKTIGVSEGAVQALNAGADMIMISHHFDQQLLAIEAIVAAVKSGRLAEERLIDAASRVRKLRAKRLANCLPQLQSQLKPKLKSDSYIASGCTYTQTHQELECLQKKIASKVYTILENQNHLLPLRKNIQTVAILRDKNPVRMVASESIGAKNTLADAFLRILPHAKISLFEFEKSTSITKEMVSEIESVELIIAGINGTQNAMYLDFVRKLNEKGLPIVAFLLQSPYDLSEFLNIHTAVAVYENTPWLVSAGVKGLFSRNSTGRLPVSIHSKWRRGHGIDLIEHED